MSSTFKGIKTKDEIREDMIGYLRDGIAHTEYETISFVAGTADYTLVGDGVPSGTSLIEITAIEGLSDDGNWIPSEGSFNNVSALVEDTDYSLIRASGVVSPVGTELYQQLRFTDANVFRHASNFYVSYKYYDSEKLAVMTNFNTGSIIGAIVESVSQRLANDYVLQERVYNSGHLELAQGSDLDRHGTIWGLERQVDGFSQGIVTVTNDGADITIDNNSAFVSFVGGESLVFNAVTGGSVASGTSVNFTVQADQTGVRYNVGSNSIVKLYTDAFFDVEVTGVDVTVTNTSTVDGASNLFSGGANDETDDDFRVRITNQTKRLSRGTNVAIGAAVESLDIVDDVVVTGWAENKSVGTDVFYVMPIKDSGYKYYYSIEISIAFYNLPQSMCDL